MQAVVEEDAEDPRQRRCASRPVITALLRKDPARRPDAAEAERMLATRRRAGRRRRAPCSHRPRHSRGPSPPSRRHRRHTGHTRRPRPSRPPHPHARPGRRSRPGLRREPGRRLPPVGRQPPPTVEGRPHRKPVRLRVGHEQHSAVPDDWERYDDPVGFSLSLPKGWKRSVSIDQDGLRQVDYSPDKGKHLVRIAVDTDPDFRTSYEHLTDSGPAGLGAAAGLQAAEPEGGALPRHAGRPLGVHVERAGQGRPPLLSGPLPRDRRRRT